MNTGENSIKGLNQAARLYQMEVLNTKVEEEFDDLVELASNVSKASIATISFFSNTAGLLKQRTGLDFSVASQKMVFYTKGIAYEQLEGVGCEIDKTPFLNAPFLTAHPIIRFYVSVPVYLGEVLVGQLSVMDVKERFLTQRQFEGLEKISKQVSSILKYRCKLEGNKIEKYLYQYNKEQERRIFLKAQNGIIILNPNGVILKWNPKATGIFGWSNEEAIGSHFNEMVIAKKDRDLFIKKISELKNLGDGPSNDITFEVAAINKENKKIDIELSISSCTINNETTYLCFAKDNTNHKSITAKLDKQKEFYETILNKIPTDIAVFDAQHRYLFVNPGAIKNPELREFIIGKDDFEYTKFRNRDIRIAEQRREKFIAVKDCNKEIRWEDTIKDPEGNTITHLRRFFPVKDEDGELKMVIGFGIDITDRKLMEEKKSALVQQLSAQNTQLVDFCNIVSHNLRAPLANMSMLVKFIEECSNEEERKTLIGMLNPVINNLHLTFNELVESIQIKQDLEIEVENISLEDCLKRTLDGLEMKIMECGATIEADFNTAPIVRYPSKYLHSIFHNLITNCLKYKDPERKLVVKIKTQKINDTILFSVEDNGSGIDVEKHKDKLFKIGKVFHRHPNSKGFGLFMTKTQVEAGGGKIWVESSPGEGATFFITFINQDK